MVDPITAPAGILSALLGVGFGLPIVPAVQSVSAGRGPANVFGYPAYGGGSFERFGITTTVPLLAGFAVVCAAECVAGVLLVRGRRAGGILALALLPFELLYWIGFSLPYGPPLGVVRTVLILMGRRSLH
jgi:hypothetical protein